MEFRMTLKIPYGNYHLDAINGALVGRCGKMLKLWRRHGT